MQHFLHFALPLGQAVSFILIDFLVTLPVWFFYLSLFQKHYGMKIREVDRNQTSESCRRRGKTMDKLSSFSRRCFCVPSSFLLRRIRKYLWKGCQCLLTNLNHCASFASWCVQHFGLSQRKEYLSKKKSCCLYYICMVELVSPDDKLAKGMWDFITEDFLSPIIPFDWGTCIYSFSLLRRVCRQSEGLSSWLWVADAPAAHDAWGVPRTCIPVFSHVLLGDSAVLFPVVFQETCVAVALCLSWPANLIFTEFWKNSPLREFHGCFDIWDRKYWLCNLFIKGPIARDKKRTYLFASIWALGCSLKWML